MGEVGKPGFSIPSPRGRVWEGYALPRTIFVLFVCGAAAWTATVNIGSRRGGWGNRVSPRPRPAGGWGNRVSPFPHPREGLGGLCPPRNNRMFIAALCGAAAWTADVQGTGARSDRNATRGEPCGPVMLPMPASAAADPRANRAATGRAGRPARPRRSSA